MRSALIREWIRPSTWQRIQATIFSTQSIAAVEEDGDGELEQRRRLREMYTAKSAAFLRPKPIWAAPTPLPPRLSTSPDVLTDTFNRRHTYLRISLTERCNLRCQYCMPAEGIDLTPKTNLLTTNEIYRLARLFVSCGIDKIRLTGGEPTVRKDIVEIVSSIAAIDGVKTVAMTTNGLVLEKKLPALKIAGLNALNISLDTLKPERFEAFTRRAGLRRVLSSIDKAVDLGYIPLKINMVVMKDKNEDEIPDFVEMTRHRPINVRFIEYMPFSGNRWSRSSLVTYKEMYDRVLSAFPQGLVRLSDPKGEVAKNFHVPGFAGDCTRLRLMADGHLKVCLFESREFSLREPIRAGATDSELLQIISSSVKTKKAAHAGMFKLENMENRAMIRVGG